MVPVQDCDRRAQPPNMGPRYPAVNGVAFDAMDADAAQEACRRALREFPDEARFKAYLGRALERSNSAAEAAAAYREAADHGNAVGQVGLALLYELGKGVPKNLTEAVKWYRLAAKQGNQVAQKRPQVLDQPRP